MRRDVYIENDSGGLSVIAVDAVDDIIEDAREDDSRFVNSYKALLQELYGDDSVIVRIVVDEPLKKDEKAQWLARASWRIDTSDGRLLVMGGFDPDVLSWWKDDHGGEGDGRGVAEFRAKPGSWQVDLYAHVGSMNGRAIISESGTMPGTLFRSSHPKKPFPLWLAHMLEYSGEEDPGHESLWKDVRGSMLSGDLKLDVEGGDPVGFLVHVTPLDGDVGPAPEEIWFDRSSNARVPKVFPLGIASDVKDPNLESFRNKLLDRKPPEPVLPVADRIVEIIESWAGDTLAKIEGGAVPLPLEELYLLHWMTALTSEQVPHFELWVEPHGAWTPPQATPDFAVLAKNAKVTAIGPVPNTGGWHTWWTVRDVARALGAVPDGSVIDIAMRVHRDAQAADEDANPAVGRTMFSGTVRQGQLEISEASPAISHDVLASAIFFVRELVQGRMEVRADEKDLFLRKSRIFVQHAGGITWTGDVMRLGEDDLRIMLIISASVFRQRFGAHWAVDSGE